MKPHRALLLTALPPVLVALTYAAAHPADRDALPPRPARRHRTHVPGGTR